MTTIVTTPSTFDQLPTAAKFLLMISTSSAYACTGSITPPPSSVLLSTARRFWDDTGLFTVEDLQYPARFFPALKTWLKKQNNSLM
jgi:hypothetical protein